MINVFCGWETFGLIITGDKGQLRVLECAAKAYTKQTIVLKDCEFFGFVGLCL